MKENRKCAVNKLPTKSETCRVSLMIF